MLDVESNAQYYFERIKQETAGQHIVGLANKHTSWLIQIIVDFPMPFSVSLLSLSILSIFQSFLILPIPSNLSNQSLQSSNHPIIQIGDGGMRGAVELIKTLQYISGPSGELIRLL